MRLKWATLVFCACAACAVILTGCAKPETERQGNGRPDVVEPAEEQREGERVEPPPEVNPNALVWRTPKPPANPRAGDVWVNPSDNKEMVYVAAGEFLMGTSDAQMHSLLKEEYPGLKSGSYNPLAREGPQRRVYLDAYWMDKTEVTNAEYLEFADATGHGMSIFWGDSDLNQPQQPKIGVEWKDARAYAEWAGKRLPTEAEWEKAARGGDGRTYPWGNEEPGGSRCNLYRPRIKDGYGHTAPVGSFPAGASPYGCLDMAGNAEEWCADIYANDYYEAAPSRNPKGPASGTDRVVRGGGFQCPARNVRCASRLPCPFRMATEQQGFRCARDAAASAE